jgi:hypothetical protein
LQIAKGKGEAMKKINILLLTLFSILWFCSTALGAIIVGRITHVEGQIYRFMDADQSWVETFSDSPAGTQDVLSTGPDSRAEIKFPNNMLVRLDRDTEVEIVQLRENAGIFALQNGLARFYNHNDSGSLVVETSLGTARVKPGSALDVLATEGIVTVSAARGQATFQTVENGVEKLEIISGSTSLEFQDESIIAGTGPIDRNWDRWCHDRENVWVQNRVVRSKYLPETMQEYAYVLEPYGSWRRIYYRGYYYWAWQPRYVTAGWTPYTTGYWYDWQEGPVWIDYNPWGWVTHHHGHWIHMSGAWLWTPYVHVSYVPGVTAVGFNIHFGKKYRPYWHPGRVRWVSYRNHIGWLPLAPRETYYGYRGWGPRSVVVSGGGNFTINISLSSHRYVDHAVIVPKHHLQWKRPAAVNHYNNVRIRNIDKTVIVKKYKPITTTDEKKFNRRFSDARTVKRAADQPEKRAINRQEISRGMRKQQKKPRLASRQLQENRKSITDNRRQAFANKRSERIGINRDLAGTEQKNQKKVILSERGRRGKQFENVKKSGVESRVALKGRPEKNLKNNAKRNETGTRVPRQAAIQENFRVKNRASTPRDNKVFARQNNNWRHEAKREKLREKKQRHNNQQSSSWGRNNKRQRPEIKDISASLKNRQLR